MSPTRTSCLALAALLLAAGCAEDSLPTAPTPDLDQPVDLDLRWPAFTESDRAPKEAFRLEPERRAVGVLSEGDPNEEPPTSAQIILPITEVGFQQTFAFSKARHRYTGNVGSVRTEAVVTFDGQVIGRQPAQRQDATPFLLDLGRQKSIVTEAYVFIDQDCGLTVNGSSDHEAKWQWFLGGQAPNWGSASMSSQAFPPAVQPPCEEQPQPNEGGGSGGGGSGGRSVTCWFSVTYDQNTGEVLELDLLYCDEVGG